MTMKRYCGRVTITSCRKERRCLGEAYQIEGDRLPCPAVVRHQTSARLETTPLIAYVSDHRFDDRVSRV